MKKSIRKMMSIILAGVMSLSVMSMTGCSKSDENNANEVPVLTWYVPGPQQTDQSAVMEKANEILEKEIGAKVEIVFIDNSAYTEKMNMYMASGMEFDLCFTGYINPYATAVQRGGLMPLDELLETVPDLKAALPDYYWDIATIGDNIYAVPNQQILATSTALVIKKDLADKYNFNVRNIKKTEDIEPLLEQIKNNEKNIYPFRTNYGTASFSSVEDTDSFRVGIMSGVEVLEKDGTVTVASSYENPTTYDNAKKLYEWYKKGYIRSDVASVMDDTQDLNAGKYGAWITVYKPGVEADLSKSLGYDVYVVPVSRPFVSHGGGRDTMIAINKNSKYPELAIKVIEQVNTNVELYNLISYGIEGEHYEKIDDKHIKYIANSGYEPKAAWKFGSQFNALLIEGQSDDVWEETKALNDQAYKSSLMGYSTDMNSIRTEISQIEAVIGEYSVIEKGAKDPEMYYDEFLSKLKTAGIDNVVKEVEKQINEFLSNK